MGRRKIEIKPLSKSSVINSTFKQRRKGLLNKAQELGVLCHAQVALIIFSHDGSDVHEVSVNGTLHDTFQRYREYQEMVQKVTQDMYWQQAEQAGIMNGFENGGELLFQAEQADQVVIKDDFENGGELLFQADEAGIKNDFEHGGELLFQADEAGIKNGFENGGELRFQANVRRDMYWQQAEQEGIMDGFENGGELLFQANVRRDVEYEGPFISKQGTR